MRFWELDYWTNSKRYTHQCARLSGVHPYKSDPESWGYKICIYGQICAFRAGGYKIWGTNPIMRAGGVQYKIEIQVRFWSNLRTRGSVHNIDKIGGTNHSVQYKINLSHSEAATVHVLGKYTRTCYYRTCGILRADFEGRQNLPEGYM